MVFNLTSLCRKASRTVSFVGFSLQNRQRQHEAQQYMISFIQKVLINFGIYVTTSSNEDKLTHFLQSLWPLESGHELVRIGPQKDGGYLIPDDLDDIRFCFSPGVSDESRFEFQLAEIGIDIFMADGSVDIPKLDHQKFSFSKHHLGSYRCISDGIEYKSLPEWILSVI